MKTVYIDKEKNRIENWDNLKKYEEVIMYCEKCGRERELKRLELGGGAGTYLCKECFSDEMDYRKYMNSKYPNIYKIENWDNLKKYEEE